MPLHVITMGVGTIMEARQVLLLAFGEGKRTPSPMLSKGPISDKSRFDSADASRRESLIDEAAARELSRRDYYRWVYDNKPEWQRV